MTTHPSRPSYRYSAFGHGLDSELPFPELREAPELPTRWRFSTTPSLPEAQGSRAIGSEVIYAAVHARLSVHDGGHRIEVDDTGRFDISNDRRGLTWETRETAWPDFVRAHLLGRVLGTALYLDGLLPLHASAVAAGDGVVAFLAPKRFGKSSLALAATAAGALLVTDDTLPVMPGSTIEAWPGVQSMRVRSDVLDALNVHDGASPTVMTRDGKRIVQAVSASRGLEAPAPLTAIYLLDPIDDGENDTGPISRVHLAPSMGAMGLLANVKIAGMLGPSEVAPMLQRAAAIARAVPVRLLQLPRDLARLDEVARTVLGWHGGAP